MQVKVIVNPDYTNVVKVGIQCQPDCEPLKFFLSGISLQNLPVLIQKIMLEEGYGAENTAVLYHSNLDEYDIASGNGFDEDEVEVYHLVVGEVVLKKKEFAQIIYEYGHKVLEVYGEGVQVDQAWRKNLDDRLQELKDSIRLEAI